MLILISDKIHTISLMKILLKSFIKTNGTEQQRLRKKQINALCIMINCFFCVYEILDRNKALVPISS